MDCVIQGFLTFLVGIAVFSAFAGLIIIVITIYRCTTKPVRNASPYGTHVTV
uniref:6-kDa protein n=1 Tax=Citrus tristeza virus TaxID=12162 RepID=Q9DTG2_9CLOS|nr:p6 protein [Citrus tristeza virus]AFL55387.1 p6 small hydrophobic protein [Citrus tristeza virus]AGK30158.1 p6 [Citrus tristeza virus]AIK23247.1 p6 [Citrus tristeza virus]AIK23267.1 p6 [Citrus tristeza virus]